jgi:hypothetical protein
MGVIKISNYSVCSRYDSKITVTIFKDRPEMTVSLNLESNALDESLFWCILGFEYRKLFNEFFLQACTYCSFSPMVLLSDELTNDEDDDTGETGIADDAGGEYEHCGIGACDPTGSINDTGLGARVDCWTDRDVWVDMGLEALLRVIERTACTRRVMKRTSLTKLGWACVQRYESRVTLSSR